MGHEKEYRQRLKYQVASAKKKTLESQVATELMPNFDTRRVTPQLDGI